MNAPNSVSILPSAWIVFFPFQNLAYVGYAILLLSKDCAIHEANNVTIWLCPLSTKQTMLPLDVPPTSHMIVPLLLEASNVTSWCCTLKPHNCAPLHQESNVTFWCCTSQSYDCAPLHQLQQTMLPLDVALPSHIIVPLLHQTHNVTSWSMLHSPAIRLFPSVHQANWLIHNSIMSSNDRISVLHQSPAKSTYDQARPDEGDQHWANWGPCIIIMASMYYCTLCKDLSINGIIYILLIIYILQYVPSSGEKSLRNSL